MPTHVRHFPRLSSVLSGHDYKFFNSTGGLLGHKRSLFEGGMRSPTMVRWPGTITPAVSGFAWAFWDFLPTAAELAGVSAPDGIDGVSIVPTLMGKTQPAVKYLFWTWDGTGVPPLMETTVVGDDAKGVVGANVPGYAVRVDVDGRRWKGVVPHCGNSSQPSADDALQLYDLDADPFETTDISGANKGQVGVFPLFAFAFFLSFIFSSVCGFCLDLSHWVHAAS
jgi:arylsulfatase A-like enzyme